MARSNTLSPRKCAIEGVGRLALTGRAVMDLRTEKSSAESGSRRRSLPTHLGSPTAPHFSPSNKVNMKAGSPGSLAKPSHFSKRNSRQPVFGNSPSVMAPMPTRSCIATISRMQSCSMRFNSGLASLPAAKSSRACNRRSGRGKLPTCSAWNGGLVLDDAIASSQNFLAASTRNQPRSSFSASSRPERAELRCDHRFIGGIALQDVLGAGESVHAGNELARNGGVIIGQVAADQLGDQLGLGGRKELPADRGRARHIGLERLLRLDDGADRGGGTFGRALDQSIRRRDRRHGVVEA